MGKSKIQLAFLLFFIFKLGYSQNVTISGFVYNEQNQERLIGAYILDMKANTVSITNDQGFFSHAVKKGEISLKVSYLGYKPDTLHFFSERDTALTLFLKPSGNLEEVTITGNTTPGSYNITNIKADQLSKLPVLAGEPDIMKSMQLLPGVQSTSEGQSGFSVHGGGLSEPDSA
jgi:hypothetical protein